MRKPGKFSVLLDFVKQAKKLNHDGVRLPPRPKKDKKPLRIPPYFAQALKKNPKAHAAFEGFSPSHKREYVEWITEAKTEETRQSRQATALKWMSGGRTAT